MQLLMRTFQKKELSVARSIYKDRTIPRGDLTYNEKFIFKNSQGHMVNLSASLSFVSVNRDGVNLPIHLPYGTIVDMNNRTMKIPVVNLVVSHYEGQVEMSAELKNNITTSHNSAYYNSDRFDQAYIDIVSIDSKILQRSFVVNNSIIKVEHGQKVRRGDMLLHNDPLKVFLNVKTDFQYLSKMLDPHSKDYSLIGANVSQIKHIMDSKISYTCVRDDQHKKHHCMSLIDANTNNSIVGPDSPIGERIIEFTNGDLNIAWVINNIGREPVIYYFLNELANIFKDDRYVLPIHIELVTRIIFLFYYQKEDED